MKANPRMWENCVGRSRAFLAFLFPMLQQTFHHQLRALDGNSSMRPSPRGAVADRVEAVSSPTISNHARFEIEQGLIEGRRAGGLAGIWSQKMENTWASFPPTDAEGVLARRALVVRGLRLFPTYTLGISTPFNS